MGQKKRLVFLTGAGVSAESGIATFRDAGGLWEQYDVSEVASHEALMTNPELVINFANARREQCAKTQPNEAHHIIAELEEHFEVYVITQNIDDLHERAGSSRVIHLHGELMKVCTMNRPDIPLPLPEGRLRIEPGETNEKGETLRPFIVYFGEAVPKMSDAIAITSEADIMVVVGTSLNVYPAAGLVDVAPSGTPIYLIDPAEVARPGNFHHLRTVATEGMRQLRTLLVTP